MTGQKTEFQASIKQDETWCFQCSSSTGFTYIVLDRR